MVSTRRVVQHAVRRGARDLDVTHATRGLEPHVQLHRAPEPLAARRERIDEALLDALAELPEVRAVLGRRHAGAAGSLAWRERATSRARLPIPGRRRRCVGAPPPAATPEPLSEAAPRPRMARAAAAAGAGCRRCDRRARPPARARWPGRRRRRAAGCHRRGSRGGRAARRRRRGAPARAAPTRERAAAPDPQPGPPGAATAPPTAPAAGAPGDSACSTRSTKSGRVQSTADQASSRAMSPACSSTDSVTPPSRAITGGAPASPRWPVRAPRAPPAPRPSPSR